MDNLNNQLLKDFKTALINKNTISKNTIQILRADILNQSKKIQRELEESEILELIAKEIKQKKDALIEFNKANRGDLVDQTEEEINVLSIYMPTPLTLEELKSIINTEKENIGAVSIKDMGKLIKVVKDKVGIKADGKTISEVVKEVLK